MTRPAFGLKLFLAGAVLAAGTTLAAANPHIRGEATAIDGDTATVKTQSGESVKVTMAPDFGLLLYKEISIDDVKAGDYLSIPSTTAADGGKQALAINVFPAAMKGTGEGVSDWDWGADSQMTNATVGTVESKGADHAIVVSYGGMQETVSVPEGTPVTSFGPDPDRTLEVGDKAVFFAKEENGNYSAGRAGVTEDGSLPPI